MLAKNKIAYLIGLVRIDDQSVQMSVDVILGPDFLLDQMVLALVVKDDVDLFVAGSANVRACQKTKDFDKKKSLH